MSMVGANATLVTLTVIIGRTKQRLKEVGAVTPETAKKPNDLGLEERWLKMSVSARAGVSATDDGRYFLRTK